MAALRRTKIESKQKTYKRRPCQAGKPDVPEDVRMKCPDCGYDNVAGADECQECGGSLWGFEP
ncbi:MAG: hypothetical protein ACM3U2_21210, partial [Deltaproteobacteria bacterium]